MGLGDIFTAGLVLCGCLLAGEELRCWRAQSSSWWHRPWSKPSGGSGSREGWLAVQLKVNGVPGLAGAMDRWCRE
jgi:hypothetical protein